MNIERLLSIFWMLGKSAKRGHHGAIFLSANLKNKDHKSCSTTIDKKRLGDAENVQFCTKKKIRRQHQPRDQNNYEVRPEPHLNFSTFISFQSWICLWDPFWAQGKNIALKWNHANHTSLKAKSHSVMENSHKRRPDKLAWALGYQLTNRLPVWAQFGGTEGGLRP